MLKILRMTKPHKHLNLNVILQQLGCWILTCTGLNSICDLKMPGLLLSLLSLPMLKWGLVGLSDLSCPPMDDDVSYVWFSCHLFLGYRSRGPLGMDHVGLFSVLLVFELFSGWYAPGPTIYDVELSMIKGSKPFTALLAYKLYWGELVISGLRLGLY